MLQVYQFPDLQPTDRALWSASGNRGAWCLVIDSMEGVQTGKVDAWDPAGEMSVSWWYDLHWWNTRSSKVFHLLCYEIKVHYIIHSSCMKMTEFFIDFSTLGLGQSVTKTVAWVAASVKKGVTILYWTLVTELSVEHLKCLDVLSKQNLPLQYWQNMSAVKGCTFSFNLHSFPLALTSAHIEGSSAAKRYRYQPVADLSHKDARFTGSFQTGSLQPALQDMKKRKNTASTTSAIRLYVLSTAL